MLQFNMHRERDRAPVLSNSAVKEEKTNDNDRY